METITMAVSERDRAYRRRLAARGQHQMIIALPRETVALLDEIKARQGFRNRSQTIRELIELGLEAIQH